MVLVCLPGLSRSVKFQFFFIWIYFVLRRNLDFQEVLDALKSKGISIRVASPKLVMEEVNMFLCIKEVLFSVSKRSICKMS